MTDVRMPELGEAITEGTITKWFKAPGEPVAAEEPLFEVSTEKVDAEVPSPIAGTVAELLVAAGTTVDIGTVVARVDTSDTPNASPATVPPPPVEVPAPVEVPLPVEVPATTSDSPAVTGNASPVASVAPGVATPAAPALRDDRLVTSPVVRRLMKDLGPEAAAVTGTGPNGRVTRKDAERVAFAEGAARPGARPSSPSVDVTPERARAGDHLVPFNKTRRVTGDKMVASKAISPHVLSAVEVDYEAIEIVRRERQESWRADEGFTLTYLPFICRALVQALAAFPLLNASVVPDGVVVHDQIDLNVAVDLNFDGLLAPVIRRAGDKRLAALAREIADVATRARAKRLQADELSGGTFTVSNSGPFGTFMVAPIINQPQVAILSTDGVVRKPVVVTDSFGGEAIAIHSVGMLVLSWDHRAFDGAYAAAFLRSLKTTLEQHDWRSEF